MTALETKRVRAAIEHFIAKGDGELRIGKHRISIKKRGNRFFVINSGLGNNQNNQTLATILENGDCKTAIGFEMKTILNENRAKAKPAIKKVDNGLAETNAVCDYPREKRFHWDTFEIAELQDFIAEGREDETQNLETGMQLFVLCAKFFNQQRFAEAMETAIDMLNFIECSDTFHAICKCAFNAGRHDVFAEYQPKLIEFTIAEFGDKGSRYKDITAFIRNFGNEARKAA